MVLYYPTEICMNVASQSKWAYSNTWQQHFRPWNRCVISLFSSAVSKLAKWLCECISQAYRQEKCDPPSVVGAHVLSHGWCVLSVHVRLLIRLCTRGQHYWLRWLLSCWFACTAPEPLSTGWPFGPMFPGWLGEYDLSHDLLSHIIHISESGILNHLLFLLLCVPSKMFSSFFMLLAIAKASLWHHNFLLQHFSGRCSTP